MTFAVFSFDNIMCILSDLFLENLVEFHAVGCNQLFLQGGCLERNCDVVGVRGDQSLTAFTPSDRHDLCIRSVENVLDALSIIIL